MAEKRVTVHQHTRAYPGKKRKTTAKTTKAKRTKKPKSATLGIAQTKLF
jgi:hypothetical protein